MTASLRGRPGLARNSAGQQAGRLVDNQEVSIFKNDRERKRRPSFLFRGDHDAIFGSDRLREPGGGHVVDQNAAILNHALERLPLSVGEIPAEAIEKNHNIGTAVSRN